MRAFAVQSFGEAPAIHDLPVPAADRGFLIRVSFGGVNPLDSMLVEAGETLAQLRRGGLRGKAVIHP